MIIGPFVDVYNAVIGAHSLTTFSCVCFVIVVVDPDSGWKPTVLHDSCFSMHT